MSYTPKGSLCRPIMHIGPAYVDQIWSTQRFDVLVHN